MLVDTSILVRTLQPHHELASLAKNAIHKIRLLGGCHTANRSERAGLIDPGCSVRLDLQKMFYLLPDTAAIYPAWERLVTRYRVLGKPSHDARLVAAMQVHGITTILTFDKTGFTRYAGIEAVHPADIS